MNYTYTILLLLLTYSRLAFGSDSEEIKTFKGCINDKHLIRMTLNIKENGDVVGFYYYESEKIHIPLHGKLVNNKIELAENLEFSGTFIQGFKGTLSNNEIKGVWADSIKKQKFKFSVLLEERSNPNKKFKRMEGDYQATDADPNHIQKLKLSYVSGSIFKFEVSTQTKSGCSGILTGMVSFANDKGNFKDEGCAALKFQINDDSILLSEYDCSYHGIQCSFMGTYKK
ncbi:MAG TPA: hypothetical protein VL947_03725 [Cytophagales bacterium]|nr:hypothetical protein [Cytophagales bacterium]